MKLFADKSLNYNGQNFEFKMGCGYVTAGLTWYKVWIFQIIVKINNYEYRLGLRRNFPWPMKTLNITINGGQK
jgi:hypothetical protein